MSFEPRDYLSHILVEVDYPLANRSDLTFEAFSSANQRHGLSGIEDRTTPQLFS